MSISTALKFMHFDLPFRFLVSLDSFILRHSLLAELRNFQPTQGEKFNQSKRNYAAAAIKYICADEEKNFFFSKNKVINKITK